MAVKRVKSYTRVVNGRTVRVEAYEKDQAAIAAELQAKDPERPPVTGQRGRHGDPSPDGRPPIAARQGKMPRGRSVPFPKDS